MKLTEVERIRRNIKRQNTIKIKALHSIVRDVILDLDDKPIILPRRMIEIILNQNIPKDIKKVGTIYGKQLETY